MGRLESLDISWTPTESIEYFNLFTVCDKLKELTVRTRVEKPTGFCSPLQLSLEMWCDEWLMNQCQPPKLNLLFLGQHVQVADLAEYWLSVNPDLSPMMYYIRIYSRFKAPMNLIPILPDFQLQFGQIGHTPFVKASKYGFLGLNENLLLLTDATYGSKTLHKAVLFMHSKMGVKDSHLNNNISLNLVTHFDASHGQLHSDHLEQLAVACPNLLELNLRKSKSCLKSLQGLRVIATGCRSLRGLHLSFIPI